MKGSERSDDILFTIAFSTPVDAEVPLKDQVESDSKHELMKVEEQKGGETGKRDGEDNKVEEDDSMEWDLRNTDSVFSELSELSRDCVESVDHGASVRGTGLFHKLYVTQSWIHEFI